MRGIREGGQELGAILLSLDSLNFIGEEFEVEGWRRSNAIHLSLVGCQRTSRPSRLSSGFTVDSRRVISLKTQRLAPLSRKCHISAIAPDRCQW
jgi:hypothetical protein